jgi:hypothetical protein
MLAWVLAALIISMQKVQPTATVKPAALAMMQEEFDADA